MTTHLDSGNQLLFQKRLFLFYFCQQAAVLVGPGAMSNIDLFISVRLSILLIQHKNATF